MRSDPIDTVPEAEALAPGESRLHARLRVAALVASFGLVALGALPGPGPRLEGAPLPLLALLPWLLLAGWPRATPWAGGRAELVDLAAALPVLGLALAVEGQQGATPALPAVGLLLVLIVLAATAARRAVRNERVRRVHGAAWLVLVPGAAALELALGWAGAAGEARAGSVLGALAPASPLLAWHGLGRGGGLQVPGVTEVAVAVLGAGAVLVLVEVLRRREGLG